MIKVILIIFLKSLIISIPTIPKIKDILLESEFGLKGEFVIIIDGYKKESEKLLIEEEKRILEILMEKLDRKLALQIASDILKKKRNEIYKIKMKS